MSRLNSTAALAGFIVNNGIVMIDKIEINWREGQVPNDAVVSSAVSRFRPILLSVSTTMLGFLPLIINRDHALAHAIHLMVVSDLRYLPLIDDDEAPIGIITSRDLIDYVASLAMG